MQYADSLIGFAVATLSEPPQFSDSTIGYATAILRRPHHPFGIKTATGIEYVPIKVWTGSGWQ